MMNEPYFEEMHFDQGDIQYPVSCFLSDSKGKTFIIQPHWHYYIELLYFIEGKARVFLSGETYMAGKDDVVLINARGVHSIAAEDGCRTQYIVIKFDPEVLYTTNRTVFESRYLLPFTMMKSSHQKVFYASELQGTPLPSLVQEIYQEYQYKSYGFELAIRTGICQVFLWVLRNWKSRGLNLDTDFILKEVDMQRLQILFDYLDKHYQEEISAWIAAQVCGMSYSYFSRQFKRIMGKTFTEYLNYIRITEAEKLLLTTDLNVTQVALHTGFTNSSYFIKQFKHYKNVPPKQFQKKLFIHQAL